MSVTQRRKGQAGEREAHRELHQHLGDVVGKRELSQTRDGGPDLIINGIDLAVEVKRQERASLQVWMDQATNGHTHRMAAVMWRPNRGKWIVAMPIDDWCDLVREAL